MTHLTTSVVGSYPQPGWLIDRDALGSHSVPRVRVATAWRVPEAFLEEAQDDATRLAIRDMERAGIDTITDGEMRRESYSNRFATALDGIDAEHPATIATRSGDRVVPRIVGPVRWRGPVEVRDVEFLRAHTDRTIKITLPGPFTMAQQASNEAYDEFDELVMDFAAAVNEEARALQAAGADVIQLDEPWLRNDPEAARRIAVAAIDAAFAGLSATTAVHMCFGYAAVVGAKDRNRYEFLGSWPIAAPSRSRWRRRNPSSTSGSCPISPASRCSSASSTSGIPRRRPPRSWRSGSAPRWPTCPPSGSCRRPTAG